ncbi:MAG TPA: RNA polymerase sigma factor [Planctomycetota bacterium]
MDSALPFDPRELEQHVLGMRRLAAALLGEGQAADDAVQEALQSAIERPPDASRPIGPWLRRVTRNAAFGQMRREGRRSRAEARAPIAAEADPVPQAVARAEAHRRVLDAVLALEEPFRSTLLLRYFEACTVEEIARRHEVAAATVRTRVHRGIARLRDRMTAAGLEWHEDCALLAAPLAPAAAAGPPRHWLPIAAAGGVLAVAALWFAGVFQAGETPPPTAAPESPAAGESGRLQELGYVGDGD